MHGRVTSLPSEPPRFFNRGPSSIAKLTFFGVISLAVMFIDARFQTLEKVRMAIATVVYPVQQAALLPAQAAARVGELFETRAELRDENERLKSDLLQASQGQQAHIAAKQESERLLKLLQMSQSVPTRAQAARVVYMGRDAFSQKAFIDRASSQVFEPGSAVVDELGLLGQLTRVHPLFAEVTLLTEKDVTIPVKLERTGTRALLYGRGPGKLPELKHVSNTLDIKEGDILLTSNIDGLFPANVRVAKVASVQRDAESGFARVECTPSANVAGADAVLVLDKPPAPPPRPVADAAPETTGEEAQMSLFRLPDSPLFTIAKPEDILLAPKPWFVALTLALAFTINLLPLSGFALSLRPDFFALVLLYWAIHQPRWIGIGVAWACGLLTDVVEANLFGQHALAYAILAFAAEYFHRRVLRFPVWQQALHVLALLLIAQGVVLVLRLMSGAAPPSAVIVLASISSALVWPVISALLQWPQRVRSLLD